MGRASSNGSKSHVVIDRVSPNDLTTLVSDRGPAPMNIAAVLVVDGGEGLAHREVHRMLDERIRLVPRLRHRLRRAPPGCGRPYWVDDERFEIARHLHFARVASETQLMELVATQTCTPLRRDRPLWAAHWVNGIGGDQAALVVVAHHVLADGIGGLAVLGALADPMDHPAGPPNTRHTSPATLAGGHTSQTARVLAADAWRSRLVGLREPGPRLRLAATGLRSLGIGRERPRLASRSVLNRPTGPRRRLSTVKVPLERVVASAHRHGCTANDIVLAAVAGAMADVGADRGERVDSLVISVPYSSRASATADHLGNETAVVPFRVPGIGATPPQRLASVAAQSRSQRTRPRSASAGPLGVAFRALARLGVFQTFIDHQRFVNTFVTNIRGPAVPLAFGGCAVSRIVPVAVTPGNTGVTFDVLSYAGGLVVTVVADPEVVPERPDLSARLRDRLDELVSDEC